jgi:lipopolysaccharide export system protein LptA
MTPTPSHPAFRFALLALGAAMLPLSPPLAHAEKADRSKPVNIEADKVTVDDRNKVHVFEGRATLTQGTLVIKANKIVVTQDQEGFQKGVATGGADGLARIRQKREGRNEYMEGEAERIEHSDKTERTQFFIRAYVKSGEDEARGQYISYDGVSESYVVTSGPEGSVVKSTPGTDNRVRVVIQPKDKGDGKAATPAADPAPDAAKVKGAADGAKPRQEGMK